MDNKYYERICDFLKAIENRTLESDLLKYYHLEAEQVEYPNALTKALTRRNVSVIENALAKGKHVLSKESYELVKYYELENTVIVEVIWKGTLSIPIGQLKAGEVMKAYFAQLYEFKDGKIHRQRNYDCFEPFM